jgi:hypothetical protein
MGVVLISMGAGEWEGYVRLIPGILALSIRMTKGEISAPEPLYSLSSLYGIAKPMIVSETMKIRVIRQNVFLTAEGIVSLGLGVSVAANPTNSVLSTNQPKLIVERTREREKRGEKGNDLPCEGESGSNENRTNTFKSIGESTWFLPISTTDIGIVVASGGTTTAYTDDTEDDYE